MTNKWLFVKYDNYGRAAYTGEYTDNRSRADIQQGLDNAVNPTLFETKTNTTFTNNGTIVNYTNNVFPITNFAIPPALPTPVNLFSINYYDDHIFDKDGIIVPTTTNTYSQPITTQNKALATGAKVRTLGTLNWATTVMAYDEKARVIWTINKDNYLQTTTALEVKLNYVGNPVETKTIHNKTNVITNLTTVDYFTYDHRMRLLKHSQKVNDNLIEVITFNKYDELGQLVQKKVGGTDATLPAGLQTVDYSFNVRGWLSKINDTNAMGSDLFAFDIKYNNPTTGGTALYNGNISQTLWKTANADTAIKKYNYSYDNLSRLKLAQFSSTAGTTTTMNTHNEALTYDKNGNINTLQRSGFATATAPATGLVWDEWLDNLKYTYQGNQLLKVEDLGNKTNGVLDPATTGDDYNYDSNGNLTLDKNKNITGITYNHFNLPNKITFSATKFIEFVYTATGTKVSKKVTNGSNVTNTYYAGNYIYESTNTNPITLQCFSQPEGYVNLNAGDYKYVYQYKDHLGNIRLSYTKNGATLQIVEENHYYPFGVKHKGYNNVVSSLGNSIAQKFKFNGKELDTSFDQNITEMDFRQYDAGLGRFYGLDLLAEATPWATPNHFALNNPIIGSDPTGLLVNFNSQSNSSEIYNPGVSGGFIDLFGNNKDSFLTNLKGFGNGSGMNGAGLGAGSGPGTGYSYINGGVGGINPGRTGNDRIDGRGGHYVRHSYSIVYHTDEETSLNKYDLTIENIQTKTWAENENQQDVKWENGDGYITAEEAIYTWRFGGGKQNLDADIKKLNLSKVRSSDFKNGVGSTIWINFAGKKHYTNPVQAIVYGNIALTLMEGNKVFVPYQDKYNFNIRGGSENLTRDILTSFGNMYNGFGNPYWITIMGTATIRP